MATDHYLEGFLEGYEYATIKVVNWMNENADKIEGVSITEALIGQLAILKELMEVLDRHHRDNPVFRNEGVLARGKEHRERLTDRVRENLRKEKGEGND